MSRTTSDVARMLALIPWLLERPGASLAEAADAFAVPERTIRSDLEHLDFCGLPGLGGGDLFEVDIVGERVVVSMADELRRPLRPTPAEALRLVLTVDAVAHLIGDDVPELRSGLEKIRSALGVPEDLADVVAEIPSNVRELRRAIDEQVRVDLDYQGRSDDRPRRRRIDPWAIHVVDGAWYLHAFDHDVDDARSFRLDRIAGFEVTGEKTVTQAPPTLPIPTYDPSEDDEAVVLEVEPRAGWVLEAVDADLIEEGDLGAVRVHLRTDAPGWVASLVMMGTGGVRVVSPRWLADDVVRRANRALELIDRH